MSSAGARPTDVAAQPACCGCGSGITARLEASPRLAAGDSVFAARRHMPAKPDSTHPNAEAFPPGLSGPALRALAGAGITSVSQLTRWTRADLRALHGMGPKALDALEAALEAEGQRFGDR